MLFNRNKYVILNRIFILCTFYVYFQFSICVLLYIFDDFRMYIAFSSWGSFHEYEYMIFVERGNVILWMGRGSKILKKNIKDIATLLLEKRGEGMLCAWNIQGYVAVIVLNISTKYQIFAPPFNQLPLSNKIRYTKFLGSSICFDRFCYFLNFNTKISNHCYLKRVSTKK